MWVRDDIARAIADHAFEADELGRDEARQAEASLGSKFATAGSGPLWERLEDTAAWRSPDGWRWAARFWQGPTVLLVRDSQGLCAFRFSNSHDVEPLLEATPGFEFYLTDDGYTFVIAFNSHDVLVGSGAAKQWVDALETSPTEA